MTFELTVDAELAAVQSALQLPVFGSASGMLKKLEANQADVVWSFLSDSTYGIAQSNSPAVRLVNIIRARYPAYRVVLKEWNTGTVGYNADVVLQAGTGGSPKTLTVYLGAVPGQTVQYALTNFAAMYPVAADLCIINFGYNQSESVTPNPPSQPGWIALLMRLKNRIIAAGPRTPIMITAQPPKKTAGIVTNADRDRHALLSLATIGFAAREGLGLIDAYTAFVQTTNYETLLISGDGIHPTTAGYDLWLAVMLAQFPLKAIGTPDIQRQSQDRIILPAAMFGTVQGTVGTGHAAEDQFFNRTGFMLTFGDAAQAGVSSWISIPDFWENFDLSILWTMASATSGNVIWTPNIKLLDIDTPAPAGSGARVLTGLISNSFGLPGGDFTIAVPAARGLTKTKLVSGYALNRGGSNLLQTTIFRRGDQAGDTATGNAELHAVILERLN